MIEQSSIRTSDLQALADAIKQSNSNKFTKLLKKFKNDTAALNQTFKIRKATSKEVTEMTALNVAVDIAFEKNDTFFLRKLLESGANPNIPVTAPVLIQAACCHPSSALPILLAKPQRLNLNIRDSRGVTALHHACQYGFFDTVSALISAGADINTTMPDGTTPLMCAAERGHAKVVQLLCENNVDLLASKKLKLCLLSL